TSALGVLDFGDIDVDPTGADGSKEGRYAMTITASKTAGNELLLTHNTYGTGQQVSTKSENGSDAMGLNTATKVWGVNVAGTVNSITATGSGQSLSIDSDGNNANGLSISYTGTSTISTTFTLTLGIAELLDRQLGFITNTSDGYVDYKKTSLGNSIDSYEAKITSMEAFQNRKIEMMINRFVAMEMSLSKIQTQSNWLSAQLGAAAKGWV
ncbi:MAG: flagellar hook protein, partial [Desulfobacterales bacterium]